MPGEIVITEQRDAQATSAAAPPSQAVAESVHPAVSPATLTERIDDLTRIVARQTAMIERLADEAKARDRRDRAGADLPLVVDLFALYGDTVACAETAASDHDRAAFTALAVRLERLLTGRGAALVRPAPDSVFDSRTMEATDVVDTDDPDADRTVAALLAPGLQAGDRSVRPASVVVRRHRAAPGR